MPYPDDFNSAAFDRNNGVDKCVLCGQSDYTDDQGICGECEWAMRKLDKRLGVSELGQVVRAVNKGFNIVQVERGAL